MQDYIGITDAGVLLNIGAKDERTGAALSNGYFVPKVQEGEEFAYYHWPEYLPQGKFERQFLL